MASPPSVIVLMDKPKNLKTIAVIIMESGMAVNVMVVVRKFSRKRNKTMTTRMAPLLSVRRPINRFRAIFAGFDLHASESQAKMFSECK